MQIDFFSKITTWFAFFLATVVGSFLMNQINLVYLKTGDVTINNPETSQAFYDELKGQPRNFSVNSEEDFNLYINILVPESANRDGRYSATIFSENDSLENSLQAKQQIARLDAELTEWQEYYDSSTRDYYLKGSELEQRLPAGKYKIEIYSNDLPAQAGNTGKYVLNVGKNKSNDILPILNAYWQLPLLKATFLKTDVLQFFLTPLGVAGISVFGVVLVLLALLYWIIGTIVETIKHRRAKTLLLTSNGMQMKEEIIKLLQKPAYDITVAFISTAAKPQENLDYLKRDWTVMRDEMGFNVEEVDIEGKKQVEVAKLLELKDIIFVEGGNAFYLLKTMRACNFEKIIRKLLKKGKVYIGSSAGSIVACRSIKTALWKNSDRNFVKLRNLKGLNLVPFDIFCHFDRDPEEFAGMIRKKMPFKWQRKKLKILTDDQAILVQGREVSLIGKGDKIVI
jgi:dipeptidase E